MIELKISEQDAAIIVKALAAMPLGEAINTFLRIQQQLAARGGVPAAGNGTDERRAVDGRLEGQ